jgi:very-short-patch-repair endonuclease
MTQVRTAAQWWAVPPARQVSYLAGVNPQLLDVALDPLPATAPAVVRFRPATGVPLAGQVAVLLDELDRAAVTLFPRWLPGAERLDGPTSLGVAAVRSLAARTAARSSNFGPFLVDLAERGLRGRADGPVGRRPGGRSRFPPEVRAAGLAQVVADAYGRESSALLIELPDELAPADEHALTATAEWLVVHGRFTVWLAGAPLRVVDRVLSVSIALPGYLTQLATETAGMAEVEGVVGVPGPAAVLSYPALSGLPRADSRAEQALERALASHEWAGGRRWNHTLEWHILGRPYRLDLFWAAEGLAVEVDGPEHRGRMKFADDRRRDVQLQLLGHDVLRFTNEQVLSDVHAVVLRIRQLLATRRAAGAHDEEKRHHVDA